MTLDDGTDMLSLRKALSRLLLRYITVRAVLLFNYQIKAVGTFMRGVAVNTNIRAQHKRIYECGTRSSRRR